VWVNLVTVFRPPFAGASRTRTLRILIVTDGAKAARHMTPI